MNIKVDTLKNILKKISKRDGIFIFLRAQMSSQIATIVDNISAFSLKKILDLFKIKTVRIFSLGLDSYVLATIVGQIIGGLVSCIINYKWTFRSLDIKFKYVLVKFVLVWIFSLFFNTFFTFIITEWLKTTKIIESVFGYYNSDDIFIFVKLFVGLIVGFGWNFLMYKHFVFRNVNYKKFFKKIRKKNNDNYLI